MLRAAQQSNAPVADKSVVRRSLPLFRENGSTLQRKCAYGNDAALFGECAECQKGARPAVQRSSAGREPPGTVPPIVHEVLRSPGQSLDPATRAFMEPRFGHDFSKVRVHTDARAAEAAASVDARAFTSGRSVAFGPGEYAPQTAAGRRLLAHELAHVVQQGTCPDVRASRVPTVVEEGDAEQEACRAASAIFAGVMPPPPSQLRDTAIRREAISARHQGTADKERLKKLIDETYATAIGKTFRKAALVKPKFTWGETGKFRANTDFESETMTLNSAMKDALSDCEWEQVIAMELGNFANEKRFNPIYDKAEKGNLSEDEYVNAIEEVELATKNQVVEAYEDGQFGKCAPAFKKLSFEDYMRMNVDHVNSYRQEWQDNYKKGYEKKHSPGGK
jgi:hypothetical protein